MAHPDNNPNLAPNLASDLELAQFAIEHNRLSEAETHLLRAAGLDTTAVEPLNRLAMLLQTLGRFEEADACLTQSLALNPCQAQTFYALVQGKRLSEADRPLIKQMEAALASETLPETEATQLHFALGKAFEDLGEFGDAMDNYVRANETAYRAWFVGRSFEGARYAAAFDAIVRKFDADFIARNSGMGSSSEMPLIVVGMMRSGTTLVEQILSGHPEVGAGGELPFWIARGREALDPASGEISTKTAPEIAKAYLQTLRGVAPGKTRVIDKMPQNYTMLGLIHLAFTEARIIHVRREAIDNCLSIYTTYYSKPPDFGLKQENIIFAYHQYERLMRHWKSVLPANRMFEVSYESLVTDREGVTRQLVEFCGLSWDDACLSPERNERRVVTPSLWQVRQPVYATSMGRWRNFEPWLGAFRELLG